MRKWISLKRHFFSVYYILYWFIMNQWNSSRVQTRAIRSKNLIRFSNYYELILIYFIVPRNKVSNVTTVIHGNDIPFPIENSNACSHSGLSCPLASNRTYKFKQTMPIKVYYPPVDIHNILIFGKHNPYCLIYIFYVCKF